MAAPDIGGGKNTSGGSGGTDLKPLDPARLADAADLVAHYKFDGDLQDSSGNDYHLQKHASAAFANYVRGVGGRRAVSLGGVGVLHLANASHDAAFQLTGQMSMVALVRCSGDGDGTIARCGFATTHGGTAADNISFILQRGLVASGTYLGGLYGGWQYATGSSYNWYPKEQSVPTGAWAMVAWVRDGGTGAWEPKFWVDGQRAFTFPGSYGGNPSGGGNGVFYVGARESLGGKLNGHIQDLMIFDTAVTEAAIQAEARRCGFYAGA